MAELGDLLAEWHKLNTPGKVVLVGAVGGVALIALAMRKKATSTSVNIAPQSQSVPATSAGSYTVTGTGPTNNDLLAAIQSIGTSISSALTGSSSTSTTTSTATTTSTPVATSTPAPAYNPFPASNFYLSQPGDTINSIAATHNTTAYNIEHIGGNWSRVQWGQAAMGQDRSGQSNFWDLLPLNTEIQFQ